MCWIQLVNTVITGFLAYSFNMYKWFVSLLNQVEQCRNFIWTSDIMKKGIATANWAKICSPLENGCLKIINLHHENNAYLLKLAWNFAYSNKPWYFLLKARVLKSKYKLRMVYKSSSIWLEIKQLYDTILDHTSWIVGTSTFINFWNDIWRSTTSLTNIAVLFGSVSIPYTTLNFGLVVIGIFPYLYNRCLIVFNHIMVRRNKIFLIGF